MQNPAKFDPRQDDVFARIAHKYDRLHDIFSFRIHRLWKAHMAKAMLAQGGDIILDAGAGTGDIPERFLRKLDGPKPSRIILGDLCPEMLEVAKTRLGELPPLEYLICDVHDLKHIPDASIDLYTNAFLMKLCHLPTLAQEAHRVLKPGGCFIMLEASRIPFAPLHHAYLAYMNLCLPAINLLSGETDKSIWRYFLNGIKNVDPPESVSAQLADAGFAEITWKRLSLGIVALHIAHKPI